MPRKVLLLLLGVLLLAIGLLVLPNDDDGGRLEGTGIPTGGTGRGPSRDRGDGDRPSPTPSATEEPATATATPPAGLVALASGRVLDDLDQPLAGVLIEIQRPTGADGLLDDGHLPGARSDEEGRFALVGPFLAQFDLRLVPAEETHLEGLICGVAPGSRDLLLRLDRGARIAGRLLLPEGLAGNWFQIRILDGEGRTRGLETARADGRFALDRLPPGPARLVVVPVGGTEALVEVAGLGLPAGAEVDDPRLAAIDLRDLIDGLDLELVDEDGRPVAAARVIGTSRRPGDEGSFAFSLSDGTGRVHLPGPARALDLEVSHEDFELLRLTGIEPAGRIVLRRAARLRLYLPAPDLALPPGIGLELRFRYGEKRRLGGEDLLASRVPDRVLQVESLPADLDLALQAPGDYEVMMSLVTIEGRREEEPVASLWLDLRPRSAPRLLPVASRRLEFRRALDRLESRLAQGIAPVK
ncbi:MAG: hypothetical protein H6807_04435 [Planctomycetes bacterium]|nr:hypothetical protein [Planctomycetota bacterium]